MPEGALLLIQYDLLWLPLCLLATSSVVAPCQEDAVLYEEQLHSLGGLQMIVTLI